ncbi:rhomboid-like protein [Streptomyces tricolor]|uniref:rhomboid-like protein n=1 Tax=Streptomyces tricolor TaxID=68277 RepID=UPI003814D370
MERSTTGPAPEASPAPDAPLPDGPAAAPPDLAGLLDGVPRQRGSTAPAPAPDGTPPPAPDEAPPPAPDGAPPPTPDEAPPPAPDEAPPPAPALRAWRLLPTPTGTPFTFAYTAILALTSLFASLADPGLVHALHQGSSTDVAHLVRTPVLVLTASALWVAGGIVSPYAVACVLVLTALERRTGGVRAACVFLAGHVLATLATEVPVGLAVLLGHLPGSSLHRLDYGISFGVACGTGALAGLLRPWPGRSVLAVVAGVLLSGLPGSADPLTDWGHLIALAIGVAAWPWVRRRRLTPSLAHDRSERTPLREQQAPPEH